MATIHYNKIDYDVVYIDPTATSAGDGTTAGSALRDVPATLANNTCYLVRRTSEDFEVYVLNQSNADLVNVMFLGYPKSTDPKWIQNLVSGDAAVSSWASDTATYANIRFWHDQSSTNYSSATLRSCVNAANIENATFINCYIYRSTPGATGNYYANVSPCLYSAGTTGVNLGIYQCKLGVKGVNLDDDTYIANLSGLTALDSSTFYKSYAARLFFVFDYATSVKISDCVFNHIAYAKNNAASDGSYGSGANLFCVTFAIFASSCQLLDIRRCIVNSSSIGGDYSGYGKVQAVFYASRPSGNPSRFSLHDITYNIIPNNGWVNLVRLYNGQSVVGDEISVTGIDINFKKQGNLNLSSTTLAAYQRFCGVSIYDPYYSELIIDNIHVHGNDDVKIRAAEPLYLEIRNRNFGSQSSGTIKNISVELAEDSDIYTAPTVLTETFYVDAGYAPNQASSGLSSMSSGYSGRWNTQDYTIFKNITFTAPYGYMDLRGVNCTFGEVVGGLKVYYGTSVDIEKLTQKKLNVQTITLGDSSNYVRIREFESDTSFTTMPINDSFYNAVYVDKSNVTLWDSTITTAGYAYSQYCCLNTKNDGSFVARNMNTFAQAWGVTNDKSSSKACLKLWSNANSSYPLLIGTDPYKGFTVTPKKTGENILTARFAHTSDLNDEVTGARQLILVVRIPREDTDGNIYYDTVYSSYTDWEDSEAVWDDGDVVSKEIRMRLNITLIKPVEIKLAYSWYSSNGSVYFDPDITIEEE